MVEKDLKPSKNPGLASCCWLEKSTTLSTCSNCFRRNFKQLKIYFQCETRMSCHNTYWWRWWPPCGVMCSKGEKWSNDFLRKVIRKSLLLLNKSFYRTTSHLFSACLLQNTIMQSPKVYVGRMSTRISDIIIIWWWVVYHTRSEATRVKKDVTPVLSVVHVSTSLNSDEPGIPWNTFYMKSMLGQGAMFAYW